MRSISVISDFVLFDTVLILENILFKNSYSPLFVSSGIWMDLSNILWHKRSSITCIIRPNICLLPAVCHVADLLSVSVMFKSCLRK